MMTETKMKDGPDRTFLRCGRPILVGLARGKTGSVKCKFYETNPISLFPKSLIGNSL